MPFFTENFEGFDINNKEDWVLAKYYINKDNVKLPKVLAQPF